MIRQRDQEKEIELKKLSEVIFSPLLLIIIVIIYHLVASKTSLIDEQEEAVGGHGGGGEQERQQVGRVAEAERDRASDTQLKVVSWCCICNGFFSFLFLVSIFLIINIAG